MQVSVESGEGLERKLTIQVPAETVDQEVENRLKSMTTRVRVDGFRPGKVPLKIVKQQYGAQVRQEVVGDVMQNSFRDAVIKEQLKPAGMPTIEPKAMEQGKPLEYVATFEVYPEVTLSDFSALSVERPKATISDADVDTMIDTLRKQRTVFDKVDRASQKDDQITISFEGFVDGVAFEGGKADNVPVVIGSGSMIPGFEDQLIGKKAGEEFSFEVSFPENYHAENLKGKPATFKTKVVAVAAPILPEIDAEFAKGFGIADGDVEKLREDIRENMQRELSNRLHAMLKNSVMDAILKANDVQVPKALVDDECTNLQQQMANQAQLQGGMSLPKELFEGEATRRVKLGLLIGEIVKTAQIKVDQDRVKAKIAEIASTYEDPQSVIDYYQKQRQLMSGIEALVMEEMVVDWVAEKAKITEVEKSFNDVMKSQQNQG
ncbi:MAG TPA: trigger factor [Gammaproteobacteria bacterium]